MLLMTVNEVLYVTKFTAMVWCHKLLIVLVLASTDSLLYSNRALSSHLLMASITWFAVIVLFLFCFLLSLSLNEIKALRDDDEKIFEMVCSLPQLKKIKGYSLLRDQCETLASEQNFYFIVLFRFIFLVLTKLHINCYIMTYEAYFLLRPENFNSVAFSVCKGNLLISFC